MITEIENSATSARVSLVGDKGVLCPRRPTLGLTPGSTGCYSFPVSVAPRSFRALGVEWIQLWTCK